MASGLTSPAADLLAGFPSALREAGLAVDPMRSVTFLKAVRLLPLAGLADLRRAGRITLVGSREDFATYDAVFDAWFEGEPLAENAPMPDEEEAPAASAQRDRERQAAPESGLASGRHASMDEAIGRKAFGHVHESDADVLRRIARNLDRLPARPARSFAPSAAGERIDLARTVRAARRTSGETMRLLRAARPRRDRRLLLLIDVSGSMKAQSEATLRFAHLLTRSRPSVETFCFGTRLSRVTATLRDRLPDRALSRLGEIVFDFDGGTRIGASLEQFLSTSRNAALVRGALTIVFSDGLERGDPIQMTRSVERLARLSHRLVWATPLAADPAYRPQTRAMAAILPFLDAIESGSDLVALENLIERLPAIEAHPRRSAHRRFGDGRPDRGGARG